MYFPHIMDFVIASAEGLQYGFEVPVFAAIAVGDQIIATSGNEVESKKLPWVHAEFLAIENACNLLGARYLDAASLYVNLEPCALCSAMLERVRIKEIFFGAYDPKGGAITHGARIFDHSLTKPSIIGGIQEQRCSTIFCDFFKRLRLNDD